MADRAVRAAPRTAAVLALAMAAGSGVGAQDVSPRYTNLRVLPPDITRAELGQVMLDNLSGLGLPRRAGEGCLFCHAGSMDVPRDEWDYASDEKPMKEKARVMMAMVREINGGYLAQLDDRVVPALEVGCHTCHTGRTRPEPLEEVLARSYREGGVGALADAYRAVRARYYAADAYDFRVTTLIAVADRLAEDGALDDAATVHRLNIEYHDDPGAHGGLIRLELDRARRQGGAAAMLRRYQELKRELPATGFVPLTLDGLGWVLYRSGSEDDALRLFELNHREHPGAFAANESLAYAVFGSRSEEDGLAIARAWLADNPGHAGGQQLLTELLRMSGR